MMSVRKRVQWKQAHTELTLGKIEDMNDSIKSGMEEVKSLKSEISIMQKFNETLFVESDDRVQFYTGLPTYKVLKTVFHFCAPSDKCTTKLSQFQEFLLTLIKLCLNSPLKDLAYRFDLSVVTASRIFSKWLFIMDVRLRCFMKWPDHESLWKTMPQCFRANFGKSVTVIIDCFEVFIDRPSNLLARAATWSNYKQHIQGFNWNYTPRNYFICFRCVGWESK